ncbi:DUF1565 domain-containing protein [Candidatus Desantisbacteria bacterium]|nr:DUF1565 domain-containing protein [Candidatus Desantisbacteria bacterium]
MKISAKTYALIFVLLSLSMACINRKKDGDNNPATQTGKEILVNANDSTSSNFVTIEEALNTAKNGDTIKIAAGTYTPTGGTLELKPGVKIEGANTVTTIIQGDILDHNSSTEPVSLSNITFKNFNFQRVGPSTTPEEKNIIKNCKFASLNISYGAILSETDPSYSFLIEGNTVSEEIRFSHGAGKATNVINNNTVTGNISLIMGSGATNIISNNTVTGIIEDLSGTTTTTISGNTINGRIVDSSGGHDDGTEDEIIDNNIVIFDEDILGPELAAMEIKGRSATVSNNTVIVTGKASGIIIKSGTPTNIKGNVITLPYIFDSSDPYSDPDNLTCAIYTLAGAGEVSNNKITGGYYGIYDKSGGGKMDNNDIQSAHIGIWTAGGKEFNNNTIKDCKSDGLIIATKGPFSYNTIMNNLGAGIRILNILSTTVPDLGGGALNGAGNNTIKGNGNYDLIIESANSNIDTIFAENNYWDHSLEEEINNLDIYDGRDEEGLSIVNFVPFK